MKTYFKKLSTTYDVETGHIEYLQFLWLLTKPSLWHQPLNISLIKISLFSGARDSVKISEADKLESQYQFH